MVIATLAAIAFAAFAKARERARQSSCLSDLKQLGLGALQSAQDNDAPLPAALVNGALSWSATGSAWRQNIQPYLKNTQIDGCPSASGQGTACVAGSDITTLGHYGASAGWAERGTRCDDALASHEARSEIFLLGGNGHGDRVAFRRREGANFGYLDGPVERLKREEAHTDDGSFWLPDKP